MHSVIPSQAQHKLTIILLLGNSSKFEFGSIQAYPKSLISKDSCIKEKIPKWSVRPRAFGMLSRIALERFTAQAAFPAQRTPKKHEISPNMGVKRKIAVLGKRVSNLLILPWHSRQLVE